MKLSKDREQEFRQKLVDFRTCIEQVNDYMLSMQSLRVENQSVKVTSGIRYMITANVPKGTAVLVDMEKMEVVGSIKDISG